MFLVGIKTLISVSLFVLLAACNRTLWSGLKVDSKPENAHAVLVETGETLATDTPGLVTVTDRFGPFEPQRKAYTVVFDRPGYKEKEVSIVLTDWHSEKNSAENAASDFLVYAELERDCPRPTSCPSSFWKRVEIRSSPAPATVKIKETGVTLTNAPGLFTIQEQFGLREPRRKTYTFVFSKAGFIDGEVAITLTDWSRSKQAAEENPEATLISAVLTPQ